MRRTCCTVSRVDAVVAQLIAVALRIADVVVLLFELPSAKGEYWRLRSKVLKAWLQ
jgi:hypothetical protein